MNESTGFGADADGSERRTVWDGALLAGERGVRRALVTGGAGFIGGHLVRTLLAAGVEVRSVDFRPGGRPDGGAAAGAGGGPGAVEAVVADLRDPLAAQAALDGVDTVFHLAGNPSGTVSVRDPMFDFSANAIVGMNVLEAVRQQPETRLVYMSSAMVYGRPARTPCVVGDPVRPFYPYGASKLAVEHWLGAYSETYGVDASAVRAFVVYGPGEDPRRAGAEIGQFLRWHLNHLPIRITGDPDRKIRDFVHVQDLVDSLLIVARRGAAGTVYNSGSGTATSLRDLVGAIESVTARPAQVRVDQSDLTDSYPLVADIGPVVSLGFRPRVALDAGLQQVADDLGPNPPLPQLDTVLSAAGDKA